MNLPSIEKISAYALLYPENLDDHYDAFSHLPGYILLESSDKHYGRYDILTALPYDVYEKKSDDADHTTIFNGLKNQLPGFHSDYDFPFQGGAIGFVSYDLACKAFGIALKPHRLLADMPLIKMWLYDWAIVVDHDKREVHLIIVHFADQKLREKDEILSLWAQPKRASIKCWEPVTFSPVISEHDYHDAFQSIHSALRQGRAYQVNFTQPFYGQYEGDAWEIYKRVKQRNPVPYAAFIRDNDYEILSFSPERFLTIDKQNILTSPIKGSMKRSHDMIQDKLLADTLHHSEKNRAENIMIVDLLRNDLSKIAEVGSVRVKALFELQSFKSVHHLVSHIQAKLPKKQHAIDAFSACFPGGSITGAPKREAMYIIDEQERYSRGVYCGSIAYFSFHGRIDSNIAIRTLIARQGELYLQVGGGIVVDSTWEDEYHECYTKIDAILRGINET